MLAVSGHPAEPAPLGAAQGPLSKQGEKQRARQPSLPWESGWVLLSALPRKPQR